MENSCLGLFNEKELFDSEDDFIANQIFEQNVENTTKQLIENIEQDFEPISVDLGQNPAFITGPTIGAAGAVAQSVAQVVTTLTPIIFAEIQRGRQIKFTDIPSLFAGMVFQDKYGNTIRVLDSQNQGTRENRGYDAIFNGRSGHHLDAIALSPEREMYFTQRTGYYYKVTPAGDMQVLNKESGGFLKKDRPKEAPENVKIIFRDFYGAIEKAILEQQKLAAENNSNNEGGEGGGNGENGSGSIPKEYLMAGAAFLAFYLFS
jgi:hypothetical protein